MKKIFVCFRHSDSAASAERINERLIAYFGVDTLLRRDYAVSTGAARPNADSAAPEEDHRAAVERSMADCGLVVLVIGPDWLESTSSGRRIDDPNDIVRLEIETALRHGIPIAPTLVQGASMPAPEQLPPSVRLLTEQGQGAGRWRSGESLLGLVCRTGLPVRRDPDFRNDTQRLCEVIESLAELMPDDPRQSAHSLRNSMLTTILILASMMVIHGSALAAFADRWLIMPGTSAQAALLATRFWLVIASWAPLLDIALITSAAVIVARRTGDLQSAIVAAVAVELSGVLTGALAFGVLTWANWPDLSKPEATSIALAYSRFGAALGGILLGIPVGIVVSLLLGLIGGEVGMSAYHANRLRQLMRRRARWRGASDPSSEREAPPSSQPVNTTSRRERRAQRRAQKQARARHAPAVAPGKVFISYRRDDSAVMCGSIYERLVELFDAQAIFKDVDMIPIGENFQTYIEAALQQSRVQLVVIGPQWLDIRGADGRRRLDDSGDFVRFEIESALRLGVTVIPVLVEGATLPAAEELPESLRPLVRHGALTVRVDPDFNADMWRLANIVWPAMQAPTASPSAPSSRPTLHLPRSAKGRTALALSSMLLAFALFGVASGIIMSLVVATSRFLAPSRADWVTVGAPFAALPMLSMSVSALLALRSQRLRRAIGWTLAGALTTYAVATATIVAYGGSLHHSLEKSPIDQVTFVATVIILALLLFFVFVLPLLVLIAIAGWVGIRLPGGLSLLSRRKLLVVDAPSNNADAQRVFAGLRRQFGGRVISLTSLLTRSGVASGDNVERTVQRGAGVVALLGMGWSGLANDHDDQHAREGREAQSLDWVVESALAARRSIIPVLLTGATIPPLDSLSPARRNLAMLNAASVRSAADFPGDMRRLNAVIERAMRLRPAWRMTGAASLALLVVALAIGVLVARGAYFNTALVLSYAHNVQMAPLGALAAVAAVDIALYLLVGALVALCVGRVGSGVVASFAAALLGNAVTVAHLVALLQHHGDPVATVTATTLTALQSDGYTYEAILGVVELFASVILGWVGAYFGSVGYRERLRSAQNRMLYQAIRQEAPAGQTRAASGASVGSAPVESDGVTERANDAEVARRAMIAAEMARAYAQARRRMLQRNSVAMSAITLLAVALLVMGSQVYQGQARTYQAQTNTIHAVNAANTATALAFTTQDFAHETVTAAAQETAKVVVASTQTAEAFIPYVAHSPGPCDQGSTAWTRDGSYGTVTCTSGGLDMAEPAGEQYSLGEVFDRPLYALTSHFSTSVTITSLHSNTCVALLPSQLVDGLVTFELSICADGFWGVYQFGYANNALTTTQVASGGIQLASANRLQVIANGSYMRFLINGATMWTTTRSALPTSNEVEISVYSLNTAKCEATFSDFTFAPLR